MGGTNVPGVVVKADCISWFYQIELRFLYTIFTPTARCSYTIFTPILRKITAKYDRLR